MQMAIANVVRVDLITEEATPRVMHATTMEDVNPEPKISAGSNQILRTKNTIHAQNNTEDLVYGHTLKMKDLLFQAEMFALCDGGELTKHADGTFSYVGPKTGEVIARTRFTADIWTEEKDADNDTVCFLRLRYPNAKGKPVKFSMKDNAFFAPEYEADSAAKLGKSPCEIDSFMQLPPIACTATELLQLTPENAATILAPYADDDD